MILSKARCADGTRVVLSAESYWRETYPLRYTVAENGPECGHREDTRPGTFEEADAAFENTVASHGGRKQTGRPRAGA